MSKSNIIPANRGFTVLLGERCEMYETVEWRERPVVAWLVDEACNRITPISSDICDADSGYRNWDWALKLPDGQVQFGRKTHRTVEQFHKLHKDQFQSVA